MEKIQAIRGMNDILPTQVGTWQFFESTARDVLEAYGYAEIRTPIVESTALFKRSIGEVTDIVEREMYTFIDEKNNESLTLRPENTAGVVRAAIEHGLTYNTSARMYYFGPMFRHERPQKGRYRQFYQMGVEALGLAGPDVDAEQIVMLARLWRRLGLGDVALHLNTIGRVEERARHREDLVKYLQANFDALDADAKRRLHTNPLRTLDSKTPAMQPIVEAAPKLLDYLGETSLEHFDGVQVLLRDAGLAFTVNPRLVRGLDYYNATVYEFVTDKLGAQGTLGGGGRYDGLFEQLGGKPTPGCGFAVGIERVLLLMEAMGSVPTPRAPDAYVVHAGGDTLAYAMRAAEALRDSGRYVVTHMGEASFKSQLKRADGSGARFAIIAGADEVAAARIGIKDLRAARDQFTVPVGDLTTTLKQLLQDARD